MNTKKIITISLIAVAIFTSGAILINAALAAPGLGKGIKNGILANTSKNINHNSGWQDMQAMRQAITDNNYSAWAKIMTGKPMADKINQNNFPQFVQMHQLITQGKFDEANKIRTELGINNINMGASRKNGCPMASWVK